MLQYLALDHRRLDQAGLARAGPRPAAAGRRLRLIGVQLMLTTAVALFFSTFSSPLLSMLLTLAVWVAGHFSGDLRNFQIGRRFAGRRRPWRAVSTTCCRTCRPST